MSATRWRRLWRHATTGPTAVRRAFGTRGLGRIEAAIAAGERGHAAQVRFVAEAALSMRQLLSGTTPRSRAQELFAALRVWDTEDNAGVLVYVLLAERAIEIVADRGIAARVPAGTWSAICRDMEARFRAGDFEGGAVAGLEAIAALLAHHAPRSGADRDELPDAPVIVT